MWKSSLTNCGILRYSRYTQCYANIGYTHCANRNTLIVIMVGLVKSNWQARMNPKPENTHLLCKGKYHCTADLLFDQWRFGQTSKSLYSYNLTKQLIPNQSNRRSDIQWYFPIRSKWVFSDISNDFAVQSYRLFILLQLSMLSTLARSMID